MATTDTDPGATAPSAWPAADTRSVPHRMVDDVTVPAARYYDPEFFALESARLWTRAWQPACRLEDVPLPGDFFEYEIVGRSLLVVRQEDGSVKAFENACRHRATALGTGCGTFRGGQMVCPFHGWRFDLDGACSYVYAERGFRPDTMDRDGLRLVEHRVATRWGMVWICPSADTPELDEALGPDLIEVLDGLELERQRVNWWRAVHIRANWKIALEAFLEAYHIQQTHPELAPGTVGDEYDADAYGYVVDAALGHGWLVPSESAPMDSLSPAATMVLNNRVMFEGVEGWITPSQLELMERLWSRVPSDLGDDEFIERFFAEAYAAGAANKVPLPPTPMLPLAYVFPNTALIAHLGNTLWYRFRPLGEDPEACIWEIWSLSVVADDVPLQRPEISMLEHQSQLPPVYAQDASNMELQQRGIRSAGFVNAVYSPRYEPMIPNFHHLVDRYLAG